MVRNHEGEKGGALMNTTFRAILNNPDNYSVVGKTLIIDDSVETEVNGTKITINDNITIVPAGWIDPKTDWEATDRFNLDDFNRIKNNLNVLSDLISDYIRPVVLDNMGRNLIDYSAYWDVNKFNLFETNLQKMANIVGADFGDYQTFYSNGLFIKYDELNRIEDATESMYKYIMKSLIGIRKIPFVCGRFKEIRV